MFEVTREGYAAADEIDLKDEQAWIERFEATTDEEWDRLAEGVRREVAAGDTDYDQLLKRL